MKTSARKDNSISFEDIVELVEHAKQLKMKLTKEDLFGALTFTDNYQEIKIIISSFENYGLSFGLKIFTVIFPLITDFDDFIKIKDFLNKNFKTKLSSIYIHLMLLSPSKEIAKKLLIESRENGHNISELWLERWEGRKEAIGLSQQLLLSRLRESCENKILEKYHVYKKSISNLGLLDLKKNALKSSSSLQYYQTLNRRFIRNIFIKEYARYISNGFCQLCNSKAPFNDLEGKPFLEVHHIQWLSKGGADSIENVIALCPNCHRKMHILNNEKDVRKLRDRAVQLLKQQSPTGPPEDTD